MIVGSGGVVSTPAVRSPRPRVTTAADSATPSPIASANASTACHLSWAATSVPPVSSFTFAPGIAVYLSCAPSRGDLGVVTTRNAPIGYLPLKQ